MTTDGFDAGTYGRSFADVYDRWYPDDAATDAALDALTTGPAAAGRTGGARVFELGVGTGRLALPLAARGLAVTGVDSSPEMLAQLAAKDPGGAVVSVTGDVADPACWEAAGARSGATTWDLVLAANNLLCNLVDPGAQRRCVELAAAHLSPGGELVVEAFLPAPAAARERRLEVRSVTAAGVTLIATDSGGTGDGIVTGAHVELVDGAPVRVRPWRIRTLAVADLDRWAADAGLVLASRHADWAGAPFDPDGAAHVSRYRRP